jgi:DNA-binding transcriptional MerR regulator
MTEAFSLEELSRRINAWCTEHEISPASGQAGEVVSERSVRYYRTLGLIDAPAGGGYGEKHLLQLTAIRLLQAQGLPLRRIRELVYGRSLEELREIRSRGLMEAGSARSASRVAMPVSDELWRVIPLDEDFLLMSRRGTQITPYQREAVLQALRTASPIRVTQKTRP